MMYAQIILHVWARSYRSYLHNADLYRVLQGHVVASVCYGSTSSSSYLPDYCKQ